MRKNQGQSLLAFVILVGAITSVIGASLTFSINAYLASSNAFQSSAVAESAATAGVQDAMIQLDRNVAFSSTGYTLPVGSSTATVSVTQNSPSANFITIISQVTSGVSTRKLSVIVAVNASTSQLTIIQQKEI